MDSTKKRRTSILKPSKERAPLSDLIREKDETDTRRVSFAHYNSIKPFTTDTERNTIWDSSYEERRSDSSGDNHSKLSTNSTHSVYFNTPTTLQLPQDISRHSSLICDSIVANPFTFSKDTISLMGESMNTDVMPLHSTKIDPSFPSLSVTSCGSEMTEDLLLQQSLKMASLIECESITNDNRLKLSTLNSSKLVNDGNRLKDFELSSLSRSERKDKILKGLNTSDMDITLNSTQSSAASSLKLNVSNQKSFKATEMMANKENSLINSYVETTKTIHFDYSQTKGDMEMTEALLKAENISFVPLRDKINKRTTIHYNTSGTEANMEFTEIAPLKPDKNERGILLDGSVHTGNMEITEMIPGQVIIGPSLGNQSLYGSNIKNQSIDVSSKYCHQAKDFSSSKELEKSSTEIINCSSLDERPMKINLLERSAENSRFFNQENRVTKAMSLSDDFSQINMKISNASTGNVVPSYNDSISEEIKIYELKKLYEDSMTGANMEMTEAVPENLSRYGTYTGAKYAGIIEEMVPEKSLFGSVSKGAFEKSSGNIVNMEMTEALPEKSYQNQGRKTIYFSDSIIDPNMEVTEALPGKPAPEFSEKKIIDVSMKSDHFLGGNQTKPYTASLVKSNSEISKNIENVKNFPENLYLNSVTNDKTQGRKTIYFSDSIIDPNMEVTEALPGKLAPDFSSITIEQTKPKSYFPVGQETVSKNLTLSNLEPSKTYEKNMEITEVLPENSYQNQGRKTIYFSDSITNPNMEVTEALPGNIVHDFPALNETGFSREKTLRFESSMIANMEMTEALPGNFGLESTRNVNESGTGAIPKHSIRDLENSINKKSSSENFLETSRNISKIEERRSTHQSFTVPETSNEVLFDSSKPENHSLIKEKSMKILQEKSMNEVSKIEERRLTHQSFSVPQTSNEILFDHSKPENHSFIKEKSMKMAQKKSINEVSRIEERRLTHQSFLVLETYNENSKPENHSLIKEKSMNMTQDKSINEVSKIEERRLTHQSFSVPETSNEILFDNSKPENPLITEKSMNMAQEKSINENPKIEELRLAHQTFSVSQTSPISPNKSQFLKLNKSIPENRFEHEEFKRKNSSFHDSQKVSKIESRETSTRKISINIDLPESTLEKSPENYETSQAPVEPKSVSNLNTFEEINQENIDYKFSISHNKSTNDHSSNFDRRKTYNVKDVNKSPLKSDTSLIKPESGLISQNLNKSKNLEEQHLNDPSIDNTIQNSRILKTEPDIGHLETSIIPHQIPHPPPRRQEIDPSVFSPPSKIHDEIIEITDSFETQRKEEKPSLQTENDEIINISDLTGVLTMSDCPMNIRSQLKHSWPKSAPNQDSFEKDSQEMKIRSKSPKSSPVVASKENTPPTKEPNEEIIEITDTTFCNISRRISNMDEHKTFMSMISEGIPETPQALKRMSDSGSDDDHETLPKRSKTHPEFDSDVVQKNYPWFSSLENTEALINAKTSLTYIKTPSGERSYNQGMNPSLCRDEIIVISDSETSMDQGRLNTEEPEEDIENEAYISKRDFAQISMHCDDILDATPVDLISLNSTLNENPQGSPENPQPMESVEEVPPPIPTIASEPINEKSPQKPQSPPKSSIKRLDVTLHSTDTKNTQTPQKIRINPIFKKPAVKEMPTNDSIIDQIVRCQESKNNAFIHKLLYDEWSFSFFKRGIVLVLSLDPYMKDDNDRPITAIDIKFQVLDHHGPCQQFVMDLFKKKSPAILNAIKFHYKSTKQIFDLIDYFLVEIKELEELLITLWKLQHKCYMTIINENSKWRARFRIVISRQRIVTNVFVDLTNWESLSPADVSVTDRTVPFSEHVWKVVNFPRSSDRWFIRFCQDMLEYIRFYESVV